MSIEQKLPEAIVNYLHAKQDGNTDALLDTLDIDATVYDEGHMYRGLQAIGDWNETTKEKFQATYEVIEAAKTDDDYVVKVQVTGNFPDSPVVLPYHFTLEGDKIDTVKIIA